MKKAQQPPAPKGKKAPRIVPKIHPDMPLNVVGNLLSALEGGKFLLIIDKGDSVVVSRANVRTPMEFLGMLEMAKRVDFVPRKKGK